MEGIPTKGLKKLEEKEDRVSALPDCLIQHILSFLPSTKEAIRTGVLSKRWLKQWTAVPVLIINSDVDTHCKSILQFYDCPKIEKFQLKYDRSYVGAGAKDSYFDEIVSFVAWRRVEDLKLDCFKNKHQVVPELFFNNVSLLKLKCESCVLTPRGKVNWACLKALKLYYCRLSNQAVEHIIFGCPLLESFQLIQSEGFDKLVVTSNSLEKLVLEGSNLRVLEISCPNLKNLTLSYLTIEGSNLFDQALKNALSVSSVLESLGIYNSSGLNQLVIASESLKRLSLGSMRVTHCLKVACARLEVLLAYGKLKFEKVELMNLPSSVFVFLDFTRKRKSSKKEIYERLVTDILQQLHHVNGLHIGRWLIEVLSGLKPRNQFSPVLHTKFVFLYVPCWKMFDSRVECILHNLPMLETLLITDESYKGDADDGTEPPDCQENYWNSTEIVYNCLVSHLKEVKIFGAPVREQESKILLNFVQYLLKNARVLERMVIASSMWSEKFKESVLSSPRWSQHTIIELKIKD